MLDCEHRICEYNQEQCRITSFTGKKSLVSLHNRQLNTALTKTHCHCTDPQLSFQSWRTLRCEALKPGWEGFWYGLTGFPKHIARVLLRTPSFIDDLTNAHGGFGGLARTVRPPATQTPRLLEIANVARRARRGGRKQFTRAVR